MIHYGMNEAEQRRRRNSTGCYEVAPLCGSGDGHAKMTREGSKVDCPTCRSELRRDPAFLNPDKMTRKELMAPGGDDAERTARHRRYFGEIAEECGARVHESVMALVPAALARGDTHLNSIPLGRWDAMVPHLRSASRALKDRGDFLSLGTGVCILKEAARRAAKKTPPDFLALADSQIESVSKLAESVAATMGTSFGEAESERLRKSFRDEVAAQLERNFRDA